MNITRPVMARTATPVRFGMLEISDKMVQDSKALREVIEKQLGTKVRIRFRHGGLTVGFEPKPGLADPKALTPGHAVYALLKGLDTVKEEPTQTPGTYELVYTGPSGDKYPIQIGSPEYGRY